MAKSNLRLIDGKFYRDGVHEPLEFGNMEQVKLMEQMNFEATALMEGILSIEPNYTITCTIDFQFKCLCGNTIFYEDDELDEDASEMDIFDRTCICNKCKQKYEFYDNEDYGLCVRKYDPDL